MLGIEAQRWKTLHKGNLCRTCLPWGLKRVRPQETERLEESWFDVSGEAIKNVEKLVRAHAPFIVRPVPIDRTTSSNWPTSHVCLARPSFVQILIERASLTWIVSKKSFALNFGLVTNVPLNLRHPHVIANPKMWNMGRSANILNSEFISSSKIFFHFGRLMIVATNAPAVKCVWITALGVPVVPLHAVCWEGA